MNFEKNIYQFGESKEKVALTTQFELFVNYAFTIIVPASLKTPYPAITPPKWWGFEI